MSSRMTFAMKMAGWLAFLGGTLLILKNSAADFGPGGEGVFIEQKGEAGRHPLWLLSLRLHVFAGGVCLLACLPQFSRALLRRVLPLHRWCGKIYAASVLLLLCPTGMVLALSAKGGLAGQGGFLLLGAATFHTTLRGITTIRGGDVALHRRWMTRSFALVTSAITFRIYHVMFFRAGLAPEANYIVSLWLSILGNLAVAELVLRHRSRVPAMPLSIPSIP